MSLLGFSCLQKDLRVFKGMLLIGFSGFLIFGGVRFRFLGSELDFMVFETIQEYLRVCF